MNPPTDNDNAWRRLNGVRIPLMIDGAVILGIVVWGSSIDSKVKSLMDDRVNVNAARIAVLEEQMKQMRKEMDIYERRNAERDEQSRLDRQQLWKFIDRMDRER